MRSHVDLRAAGQLSDGATPDTGVALTAVLFHLDAAQLDRKPGIGVQLQRRVRRQAAMFGPGAARRYVARLVELDDREVDRSDFFDRAETSLGLAPGSLRLAIENRDRGSFGHGAPLRPLEASLGRLRRLGLKLGLIVSSDRSGARQERAIRRLGLRERFDSVVISRPVGREPDSDLFQRCLADLGEVPEACVYVGTHPDADVVGAKRAGLAVLWYRDPVVPAPGAADAVIGSLSELEVWARVRIMPGTRPN